MANNLTTSGNILGGKKIELTPEQKKAQKIQDKKVLESYNLQIEVLNIEINKLEKYLGLKIPERETRVQLETFREQLKQFLNLKKVIEGRNK